MDIIFIICSLFFILALIFFDFYITEENNATAGYDDSILVIEVFDDDEEESNYELKESIINAFQLFMKNLAKEYELIEENEQIRAEKLVLKQENDRIRAVKLVLEQENERIRGENLFKQENQFKEEFQKEKTWLQTNQATNYNSIKESTSINATNYNFIKETPADSVKEKNMNKEKSLLLRQENGCARNKYLHLEKEDELNFANLEHSSDNVKKQRFKKTQKRFLAALEIKRLLNKLYTIDPSLAYTWCKIFNDKSDIQIIESRIKYLDNLIYDHVDFGFYLQSITQVIGIEGMIDNAIIEFFLNHTFDDFIQLRIGDDVVSGALFFKISESGLVGIEVLVM
ncbi:31768_t:CDS:2 [Gigaspora margarita]|uniref:31768_t:CDS:1 n=1 Tax=Gigaspora margarita TaxID=4874 RepID=A0ABM8W553_GIGMA|nr:31768_t:CDS:2 [Gigaspora margarita]